MICQQCRKNIERGKWHGDAVLCRDCSTREVAREHDAGHHQQHVTVVVCSCGRQVDCPGFSNSCDCGRDYNWSGQKLAPRSQWGEETGEPWWECY